MSLRHAMLGLLTLEPMTGYELVKVLDDTIGMLWAAPHSQIYPELKRMEAEGLIAAEPVVRGQRALKRVYAITKDGVEELQRWERALLPFPPERDEHRLQAAYLEFSSPDVAKAQLESHLRHWSRRAEIWTDLLRRIEDGTYPLLKRRLAKYPAETHDAIIAFKALAFDGQLRRAEAEIEWARRALDVLSAINGLGEIQAQTADTAKREASRRASSRARRRNEAAG